MLQFLESIVLGMWNDAAFPSLSSPLSSSSSGFGNPGPWMQSSNASPELERLSCGNYSFGALQDNYSDCLGLGSHQPKAVAEPRKRMMITGDPVNKNQTTSPLSKRLKTVYSKQQQHHLQLDESTMARMPLIKAPAKRSQKLGDKITALQQLVSPFGKTDTSSVLQEAALCVKFLHEQIKVLTAPYLGIRSSEEHDQGLEENNADLKSRGLYLVPVYAIVELMDQEAYEIMARETGLNLY